MREMKAGATPPFVSATRADAMARNLGVHIIPLCVIQDIALHGCHILRADARRLIPGSACRLTVTDRYQTATEPPSEQLKSPLSTIPSL
jgi:hypothetical protein